MALIINETEIVLKTFAHDIEKFENIVHLLNYRWSLSSLALWTGDKQPFEADRIYEGYEDVLTLDTIQSLEEIEDSKIRTRLKHAFIDHYLQQLLLPHENEMKTWMKGAAAHVNGEKIYFREIISWCQKSSTYAARQSLQKETAPLCKFLKPFALNYWHIMLDSLKTGLGFESYVAYCKKKKGIDYDDYYALALELLDRTDALYFPAMERWSRNRFNRPLAELTRYDAINLLGLGQFDEYFPDKSMEDLCFSFFRRWGIDLENLPGLTLKLENETGKSAQAVSFILQVPDEVYVVMRPEGGWMDLETIWHELGHGLSAVFTAGDLSITERDLSTSFSLSESFAFLLQNIPLSLPFLNGPLKMPAAISKDLQYYKILKDLSVFRRYAAKFIAEYDMFSSGNLSDGERYGDLMTRYTGFYHQPETHLFDLAPEFYCLDYMLGWMAEAIFDDHLRKRFGGDWIYHPEAVRTMKKWWHQGNQHDLPQFLEQNDLGGLTPEPLLRRWENALS
jgi:hypothetical protein